MINFPQQASVISGAVTIILLQLIAWGNIPESYILKGLSIALGLNSPALADPIRGGADNYTPPNRGAPGATDAGGGRAREQPTILGGEINYTPPDRGAPGATEAGGGRAHEKPTIFETEENWTRGDSTHRGTAVPLESLPRECSQSVPVILVPQNHVGQTTSGYPTFFWHLSDRNLRTMVFSLKKAGETKAIFTQEVEVDKPGIVQMKMPKEQQELVVGQDYLWSVSFACKLDGQKMKKIVVEAGIRRVAPTAELTRQLNGATSPQQKARVYAQQGYWYNALEVLAAASTADPNNKAVYEDILSLLDQVGLDRVTAKERQQTQR